MKGTDQQSKGNQAQTLPGASQVTSPADQQTTPGEAGKGEKPWFEGFTPDQWNGVLALDRKSVENKAHSKLRKEGAEKDKKLAALEAEHPLLLARLKELEDLQAQWEDEGAKKNPDLAEINRIKREYRAKTGELATKERALQLSLAEHAEDLKKFKANETKEQAVAIAAEFGVELDDILATNPTSEEQMRSIAETLNKRSKGSEQKKNDSGVGSGSAQEQKPEAMSDAEYQAWWRKKHPLK